MTSCIECNKKLINHRSQRCLECYNNYKKKKISYCVDCGKELSKFRCKRCRECNTKYLYNCTNIKEKIGLAVRKTCGTDKNIEIKCLFCNKIFILSSSSTNKKRKYCSKTCANKINGKKGSLKSSQISKERWSEINKLSYVNGKKVGGGTSCWYKYKNIKVQGTYELRTCFILDELKRLNKIKDWKYAKDRYEYIGIDNKKHSYLIDFKIIEHNNIFYYIEVKGFKRLNDDLKWNNIRARGYKLDIWFLDTIEKYENELKIKESIKKDSSG